MDRATLAPKSKHDISPERIRGTKDSYSDLGDPHTKFRYSSVFTFILVFQLPLTYPKMSVHVCYTEEKGKEDERESRECEIL